MGGRVGGKSSKFYREKKGIKVVGGEAVKKGTILTREGHRWQPGLNVFGDMHVMAGCDGEVYFTRKRKIGGKVITYINIRPSVVKSEAK
jgi:ribosomal protein L27